MRRRTAPTIIVVREVYRVAHSSGLPIGVERHLRMGTKTGSRCVSCRITTSLRAPIPKSAARLNDMIIVKQRATVRATNRYYASF